MTIIDTLECLCGAELPRRTPITDYDGESWRTEFKGRRVYANRFNDYLECDECHVRMITDEGTAYWSRESWQYQQPPDWIVLDRR